MGKGGDMAVRLIKSDALNAGFKTMAIGDYIWMAEDLKAVKFRNGDAIPEVRTEQELEESGENMRKGRFYITPTLFPETPAPYLVEKALSIDNIFVIIMIFSYFQVPAAYQHKVLFWGILGALVMRAIFIFAGVALIEKFHFTIYIFGALLIYTGYKMFMHKNVKVDPDKNPLIRLVKRLIPVTHDLHGDRFFVNLDGKHFATPLFLVVTLSILFSLKLKPKPKQ